MDRPKLEVADVLRRYGEAYREQHAASLSTAQRRVMRAIELCRTAALGSHPEQCDQCPYERVCYDSCRNRHCPKCQCLARAQWIEDRQSELLDTQYFHVVFTLPEEIAAIAYQNKELVNPSLGSPDFSRGEIFIALQLRGTLCGTSTNSGGVGFQGQHFSDNALWISLTAASGSATSTTNWLYRSSCRSITMVLPGS
jgi:hypothetical protein